MILRCTLAVLLVLALPMVSRAAGPDPYTMSIVLSDGASAAVTTLSFSFRATNQSVEKVGEINIQLAEGTQVNGSALSKKCRLDTTGPKAGEVCAQKFRDTRIGEGQITVDTLGVHTVSAEGYLVDGAPNGANIVFYFHSGQVFGVGAQSIFGTLSLGEQEPVRIRIHDIQKQLDLPLGATAEVEKASFTFAGEPGKPAFTNPPNGSMTSWIYKTELSWPKGGQTQAVHATAAR